MWGVALTPTLGLKLGLALLGAGCLAMGLRRSEPPVVETPKSASSGIDWQELLGIVLTQWRAAPEDLSPSDLDRIILALRNSEGYRSRSQSQPQPQPKSYDPDLTAH